jgi:hypothetical protein
VTSSSQTSPLVEDEAPFPNTRALLIFSHACYLSLHSPVTPPLLNKSILRTVNTYTSLNKMDQISHSS